jgi:hypothetical protein
MYGGGADPGAAELAGGALDGGAAEPAGRGGNGVLPDAALGGAADPADPACGSAWPDRSVKTSDPRKPRKTPPQASVPAMVGPFSDGMLGSFLKQRPT